MSIRQFTLHKISKTLSASAPMSHTTIDRYEQLNRSAGNEAELALQLILQADLLKNGGLYIEALQVYEKAGVAVNGDISLKMRIRNVIRSISDRIQDLAIENISDPRIGPLYDYFYRIGNLSLFHHAYAILHYKKTGETEKANLIAAKLKKIAPHFKITKTKE